MVARTHIIDTESCCSQKKLCVCKVPMLSGALDIGSSYILDCAWFSQALLGDCDGSVTAHAPASDARTSSAGRASLLSEVRSRPSPSQVRNGRRLRVEGFPNSSKWRSGT